MIGNGAALDMPALPITALPVTVQLLNNAGSCWQTTFTAPQRNDEKTFKSRN
jgi:hypothetical protein